MSSLPNHQFNTTKNANHAPHDQAIDPQVPEKSQTNSFDSYCLPEKLVSALRSMGISCPTPIQAATIALGIEGRDVMASAQTGTGKTLAYTLPLLARLLESPHVNALILTPTRELATQVRDILRQLLGRPPSMNIALLIGGESMGKQFAQLQSRPRIIVGTPGRISDHINRGTLSLKHTSFLVVDEADRMLDMGFSVQLDRIAEYLPKQRQTLMFSATVPSNILKLAQKYLQDPVRVCIDSPTKAAPKIKQEIIRTTRQEKYPNLLRELNERDGSIIIFVKTKRGADQLADKLRREDLSADSIHGDLKQRQRDRAILHFRNNKTRIMVATDVAARGLDIPHIRHVINYDLPQDADNYIHRIGRTARAGLEGNALCLLCPDDSAQWNVINRLMNPGAPKESENQGGKKPHENRLNKGPKDSSFGRSGAKKRRPDFLKKRDSTSNEYQEKSQSNPNGKPSAKFQGKAWGKPDRNSSEKQPFQKGAHASGQQWGTAKNKPSRFKPNGLKKSFAKRGSHGS